jgi:hypothetical protein
MTAPPGNRVRRQEPGTPRVVSPQQVIPLDEGDFKKF